MEQEMSFVMTGERKPTRAGEREQRIGTESTCLTFEALARRVSPTLKSIAHKLNGQLSFVDDQDLFQEGLIHLWTHFTEGTLSDKTDSYILQGCYYHMKNYIRKTRDKAVLLSLNGGSDEDGSSLEESLPAKDFSSQGDVDEGLQIEAIVESGMSRREKDVLAFSLEGMTTREIGMRLGVSHVSVVKIRSRIKERYVKLNGPRLQPVSSSAGYGRF
jgi:RNA polymerase sigma factor (sigma-70 family)